MGFLDGLFGQRYKRPDTSQWQMPSLYDPQRDDLEQPLVGGQALISAPDAGMQKEEGFWQGGEHFGGRDAVAMILAAIGDGLANRSGRDGGAGDWLMGSRLSAIAMAKKQQEKQAEIEAMRQRYVAAGVDPSRADLAANGGESGWLPKPDEPTAFMRNEQYVGQKYGPDAGRAYAAPALYGTAQGPDGRYYPKTAPQLDPNEWEPIDEGGPTSPASGNFPRTRPHYRY